MERVDTQKARLGERLHHLRKWGLLFMKYITLTKRGTGHLLRVLCAWWAHPREQSGSKTGEKKHVCVELL